MYRIIIFILNHTFEAEHVIIHLIEYHIIKLRIFVLFIYFGVNM